MTYSLDGSSSLLKASDKRAVYGWVVSLGILLILGLRFRFANLDKRMYWHDEVFTSLRASGYTEGEINAELSDGSEVGVQMLLNYQRPGPEKSILDTIKSVMTSEPENPPLYILMSRLWMQHIGNSPAAMRSLAAVISIFAIPGLYWLSLELFETRWTALFAVALICLSPVHVLFAREARMYSLWTVFIILASAALLRALRLQSKSSWALYAATVALGFYSHLLFALVAVAHGLYVLLTVGPRSGTRILSDKSLAAYFLASLAALLTFVPWIVVITTHFPRFFGNNRWMEARMPLSFLIKRLTARYSAIFIDFEPFRIPVQLVFVLPVVVLVGYSLYFLWRKGPKKTRLFVFLLIGVTATALALPDLILGGYRSAIARYTIPCFVGIQLAVAYFLTTQLAELRLWRRRAWQLVTIALLSASILSDVLIVQAESWWDKGIDHGYPQVIQIINKSLQPLLIVEGHKDTRFGYFLAFGHELDPHVRVKWGNNAINDIRGEYSDIFLYRPSPISKKAIVQGGSHHLEAVVPGLLLRLTEN